VLPHTYPIPGLGQLEHYPGKAFMTHFVARCGPLSLDIFGLLELSGLMTVGDEAHGRTWAVVGMLMPSLCVHSGLLQALL
jgi:hypothetical protein